MSGQHLERAGQLVEFARAAVTAANETFCAQFPILREAPLNKWDFFGTVAAVWSASTMIGHDVPESSRADVESLVEQAVDHWQQSGLGAMADLSQFVARSVQGEPNAGSMFPAAVGSWMFWKFMGRPPANTELPIVNAMGRVFCEQFANYWQM